MKSPVSFVVLGFVLATASCASNGSGFKNESRFNTAYRSIAIPVFDNSSAEPQVSQNLTEALIKTIQAETPWKVTAHGRADTMLRGSVRRYRLVLLSKDPTTGLANEMLIEATVDFEWIDLRTGEPILAREAFTASSLFTPSRPSGQPSALGRFEVVQALAGDIVDTLQANW